MPDGIIIGGNTPPSSVDHPDFEARVAAYTAAGTPHRHAVVAARQEMGFPTPTQARRMRRRQHQPQALQA